MPKLRDFIKDARRNDITFWQETKLSADKIADLRAKWGFHEGVFLSAHPQGGRRGVITLFSPKLQAEHLEHKTDDMGQYVINVTIVCGIILMFINIYGDPDTDANSCNTLTRLEQVVINLKQSYDIAGIVMGGDFNLVLNDADTTSTSRKPHAQAKLEALIQDLDIYDVALNWNAGNNIAPPHTYFMRLNERVVHARYDRFYASPHLIRGVNVDLLPRVDDHAPVHIILWVVDSDPKPWMFDDAMLDSPVFVQKLQDTIRSALQSFCSADMSEEDINNIQTEVDDRYDRFRIIDHVFAEVTNMAKVEMEIKKININRQAKEAFDKLVYTRREYNEDPNPTEEKREAMEEAKAKYRDVLMLKGARQAEANRIRYAQSGERVTKYHFGIMNRGMAGREIFKLTEQVPNGQEIPQAHIPEYMADKYRGITARDRTVGAITIRQFLGEQLADEVQKCPEEMEEMLIEPFTAEELESIIKDMKSASAPGPEGISNRLLKAVFPTINILMAEAGNTWLLEDNEMPPPPWITTRKVIFIPKPGKRRDNEDSYRGLSMLENVYKVFSKAIAKRLAPALYAVQDSQQFGFTVRKGCMEASRTVIDAIRAATEEGAPLVVMNTDMYKAFDTIDKQHILNCLEFFQFPPKFRRAVERLTREAAAKYEVNGKLSSQIMIERGTGQGDPISSFAFNLAVTPLNLALSALPIIPRIQVRGIEVPPVFFADDNSILLKGHSLPEILTTIQKIKDYEKVSGLKLNPSKCELLPVNCSNEILEPLVQQSGMKLVQETRHLGININAQGLLLRESNVQPILDKLEQIANRYSTCLSTPIGRALYAKFLLGSRYVHLTMNRHMNHEEAQEFRESILQMTWTKCGSRQDGGASHRVHISKKIVAQGRLHGGLSVPDPQIQNASLRIAWARKFQDDEHMTWYLLLNRLLSEADRPSPKQHLLLGHREWVTSGDKIMDRSDYWGHAFKEIGEVARAAMVINKEWHLIPLIGSEDANHENNIGSLTYANPRTHAMIDNGLINIGHLFQTNEAGHILQNRIKPTVELNMQYNNCITLPLMNSIAALVQTVKRKYRLQVHSHTVPPEDSSPLLRLIQKYSKGCTAASEVLLALQRLAWSWGDRPRAHMTYTADGLTGVSEHEYSMAFTRVRSRDVPPSAQWTSTQVLTRTLWTRVKESNTARGIENGVDGTCMNCLDDIETTRHMMYQCPVATQLWDKVFTAISQAGLEVTQGVARRIYPVQHNIYAVLFLKLPHGLHVTHRRDIYDLTTVTKHVLYKVRFRDDPDRIPSVRRLTILTIEDLELTALLKRKNGSKTELFDGVIDRLRSSIGWN